jgi:hypothetical protein
MTTPDPTSPTTPDPAAAPAAPPAPPAPPPASAGAMFTQDQMTAVATREAEKAARAAHKALLDELGLANKDELKAAVKGHRDQQAANQTAAEKAAEAETRAAQAAQQATAAAHGRVVDRALIAAGAPVASLDRVARLVDSEPGADPETVLAAVAALKTEFPALFSATSTPPPPSSEPAAGGPPPAPSPTTGLLAAGAARAQARQGRTTTAA